ncbi:MAG: DMT family transporter [Formosimonas sp.]
MPTHPWRTYLQLVLTTVVWGATWVAAHILVEEVPPFTAAFLRFCIAVAALAWLVSRKQGGIPRAGRQDVVAVLWLGFLGVFLYNFFFLTGLQTISAGRGALVIAFNPILIALVSWLYYKEPMSVQKAVGIVVALMGCVLVISDGQPARLLQGEVGLGEILILGCAVSWTLYTFIGRRVAQNLSPLVATFYASVVGCVLLGVAALFEQPWAVAGHYSFIAWLCLIYLGVFGTALGYTWYVDAVQTIGADLAAPFINLTPISGVLFGALILHERLDWAVLLGGVITILGVLLTVYAGRQASK